MGGGNGQKSEMACEKNMEENKPPNEASLSRIRRHDHPEYKRVPCRYCGYNIVAKVHERSYNPHCLAIIILYVGGTYDVTAVQLWQEDCQEWRPMCRAFGMAFYAENPPRGNIRFKLQLSGSAGLYWVESKNVIPSD